MGMRCMNCGEELQWNSDAMEDELLNSEEIDPDDNRVVGFYDCPRCGYSYEVYSPSENQMKELEFYTEDKE